MRIWQVAGAMLAYAVLFPGGAAFSQRADDPLTKAIEPEAAARWLGESPPVRIYGNSYLVGFEGLTVALIRTDAGLILIDGAVPQAVPALEANIRKLGFKISDIKLILSTEPHFDHAGGLAALARDSGATVVGGTAAIEGLRTGQVTPGDPQAGWYVPFPGVSRLRAVSDGEAIRLGTSVVTARATPGHTPGSMSWTWQSCEAGKCLNMVFGSSLNPLGADGWRFSDPAHAATVASFRATFAKFRAMPCDVLLSAHPAQSAQDQRLARFRASRQPNPFIDPAACRAYADKHEAMLDRKIAEGK